MAKEVIPNSLSIHPRNWGGVRGFGAGTQNTRRNTAKPKQGRSRKYDRKAAWLSARRIDREVTVRGKPMLAASYRVPGSMNEGK